MRNLKASRENHACLWLEEFEFASKGFKVENENNVFSTSSLEILTRV